MSFDRSKTDDLSSTYDEREKDVLKATVTWPFYSGGKNYANLNKSKSTEVQKNLLLENSIKKNQTDVASAWSSYQSLNQKLLNSVRAQKLMLLKLLMKVLLLSIIVDQIEQLLRLSNLILYTLKCFEISLADSEKNDVLSQFNLLKSIGLLNSEYLKIR